MSTGDSWNDLKKILNRKISIALENEVFEEVRDVMQQHIKDDVYDVYTPKRYVRRYMSGGLIADSNIDKILPNENTLVVSNNTPFKGKNKSGGTLTKVVETGIGYKYHNGGDYEKPRPFVENTIEDLSQNKQHITALKIGLERTGLQIK